MSSLSKTFPGGKQILKDTWLSFFPNAKIGIIGANGSGKSTLLKIMAGIDTDFVGEAWAAKGAKIGYLEQEPKLDSNLTVFENILSGLTEQKKILEEFEEISTKLCQDILESEMNELIEKQMIVQEKIDAMDLWDLDRTIEIAMDALRCPDKDADVTKLSGGERRRVALCKLLMQKPDLLLLDEPTNHLDTESVAWLEKHLQEYKGAIVLITHDRYFLDNVVGWILEIDKGNTYPFEGNYSAWLENKMKRMSVEEDQEKSKQRFLSKELEWIRQSPKARQAKSKARINAYNDLVSQQQLKTYDTSRIYIPSGPRLGDTVITVDSITKAFEDKLLFENLSFEIPPGAIVGIIGANGAGKSTLFKCITGQEKLDFGNITIGETVKFAYVDQSRDQLDGKKSVWEEISNSLDEVELGGKCISSRAYVANFGFKGVDQQKKIHQLSGGERNRVHLAKVLKSGANVLMLDEPTNDLDVDTLQSLEGALSDFLGCALIISHDRWFLNKICTHILSFEGDSCVEFFFGDYVSYEEYRQKQLGIEAGAAPHKIKYKPLMR